MTKSSLPIIICENLHKSYGTLEVLKGVNVEFHQGDVVSIIAPSGCGKTTFIRCLNRLESVTSGTLQVMGIDISDHTISNNKLRQLRSKVSMVFQHFNLFPT